MGVGQDIILSYTLRPLIRLTLDTAMLLRRLIVLTFVLLPLGVKAQYAYDKHVVFDNSLTARNYFHSEGRASAPSTLRLDGNKLPVATEKYFTPPNAIELRWKSMPGGGWEAALHVDRWRNRSPTLDGDTLTFWCHTAQKIDAAALPRIQLKDSQGNFTAPLVLGRVVKIVPANEWTRIKVPLALFSSASLRPFAGRQLQTIYFLQNQVDAVEHALIVDEVKLDAGALNKQVRPAAPSALRARGYDKHVDLSWQAASRGDVQHYVIHRSFDNVNYEPVGTQAPHARRYADYVGRQNQKVFYKIKAVARDYRESEFSATASAATRKLNDEELLTMVQEANFRYYWDGAHPVAGMALENIPGDENIVATGASGFGIMALVTGVERKFVTRREGAARMARIVEFLERADRFHGAWPHFLDGRTGRALPVFDKYDGGGDLVETAFLVQGLLVARQYFAGDDAVERRVRDRLTKLWETVEWDWYRRTPDGDFLYWHWSPEYAWHLNHKLIGWNETMIAYLLAIASPTHQVPASLYYSGWASQSAEAAQYRRGWGETTDGDWYVNGKSYYDVKLDVGVGSGGPLFFAHYSFLGFDPRGIRDRYTNYFENNRRMALINRAYCADNPGNFQGYSSRNWGLTASDGPRGYRAHEPKQRLDDGTMTPTGALASFPYTPDASFEALRYFYDEMGAQLWGVYGFRDAFNESENWVAPIYMGLNQAPITVMIENHRSGLIWKLFMSNPEIKLMLDRVGFRPDGAQSR